MKKWISNPTLLIKIIIFTTFAWLICTGFEAKAIVIPDEPEAQAKSNQLKTPNQAQTEGQVWNLKETNILTLIHQISQVTGKNFIVDPNVRGNVTFVSSHPLKPDEVYQAFLAILQVYGYTAVPSGDVVKIVPMVTAKQAGVPELEKTKGKKSEEIALRVIRVENVSASEMLKILRPLVPSYGYVDAYQPTNDIIISDLASNINKLTQLIYRLDQSSNNEVEVIHLQYASAEDVVKTLTPLLKDEQAKMGTNALVINFDPRTNSLLVSGGSLGNRSKLRQLITKLDAQTNRVAILTEVIPLKHLRAENAAPIISGLIEGFTKKEGQGTSRTSTTNTPTSAPTANNSSDITGLIDSAGSTGQPGAGVTGATGATGAQTGVPDYLMSQVNEALSGGQSTLSNKPKSGSISPQVQWEGTTNSLIITAPFPIMQAIKKVIAKLDIRRPQVLIEAVIAEVTIDRAKEMGVEWNSGGALKFHTELTPNLPISTSTRGDTNLTNPLTASFGEGLALGFFKAGDLRVLLKALGTDNRSNVLATPNIVTLDNEKADIKVGRKVSFAIAQVANQVTTGGNPYTSFDRQDVGLILSIRPQITPRGAIKLEIAQDLSSIIPGTAGRAGGNPDTSERFIHTTVIVDHGECLVLGGLIQTAQDDSTSKVPILGDIPGIGLLFRDNSKSLSKTNLMIFLRPTILRDSEDNAEITQIKTREMWQNKIKQGTAIMAATEDNNIVLPALPTHPGKPEALPDPF